jgi:anti-sigma-K factor RskA
LLGVSLVVRSDQRRFRHFRRRIDSTFGKSMEKNVTSSAIRARTERQSGQWPYWDTERQPRPAGLFRGGSDSSLALRGTVPRNSVVAVTLEPDGGSGAPTTTPIFTAHA